MRGPIARVLYVLCTPSVANVAPSPVLAITRANARVRAHARAQELHTRKPSFSVPPGPPLVLMLPWRTSSNMVWSAYACTAIC